MITKNVEIQLTVEELAYEVSELDAVEQIAFINNLGEICKTWKNGVGLSYQLQNIRDFQSNLTPDGKWFINKVSEYLI